MGFFMPTAFFLLGITLNGAQCRPNQIFNSDTPAPSNQRYNYFDVELFEVLAKSNLEENLLVSPISVKLLLGMLMEGLDAAASDEIRTALRLPENRETALKIVRSWVSSFSDSKLSKVAVAAQLFVDKSTNAVQSFRDTLKHYRGDVTKVALSEKVSAAEEINKWVRKNTNDLIKNLVSPESLSSEAKAVLASAVYFKADWLHRFNKNKTSVGCFTLPSGECRKTHFMYANEHLRHAYVSTLDAQVLELPYQDPRYAMLILLPKKSMRELSRDLFRDHLPTILDQLFPQDVFVQLPRFEISYEKELMPALRHLQVNEVFSPNANFRNVLKTNGSFSIGSVLHSAKITVDEDGSEAAAATGAIIVPLMGSITARFVCDKPFYFFIRDVINNNILFAGRLSVPEAAVEEPVVLSQAMPNVMDIMEVDWDGMYEMEPPVRKSSVSLQKYVPQPPGKPVSLADKAIKNGKTKSMSSDRRKDVKSANKRSSNSWEQIHFV